MKNEPRDEREARVEEIGRCRTLAKAVAGEKLLAGLNSSSKGPVLHGNYSRGASEITSGVMRRQQPLFPPGNTMELKGASRVTQLFVPPRLLTG